jgi:hypothetical protein
MIADSLEVWNRQIILLMRSLTEKNNTLFFILKAQVTKSCLCMHVMVDHLVRVSTPRVAPAALCAVFISRD